MATVAYTFSMPQAEAYGYTLKALQDAGARIGTQIPQGRIDFALTRRERAAGSIPVALTGHCIVSPLPGGQTNATVTLGPVLAFAGYAVAIAVLALLFGSIVLGSLAGVWSILVLAILAYGLWLLFAKLPETALADFTQKMQASSLVVGGGPAAPLRRAEPPPESRKPADTSPPKVLTGPAAPTMS